MEFTRQYDPIRDNCFVIMPYGKKKLPDDREFDWDRHYKEVIAPAINEIGMKPTLAGDIYGTEPLIDSVWKAIQEAEIVIADLTGQNPNVLYELGLAHVIGKRVVLLRRKGENIPVDIAYTRQFEYNLDDYIEAQRFPSDLKKNVLAARDEPIKEKRLEPFGWTPVDGRIHRVVDEYAIVETVDGKKAILGREDLSWGSLSPKVTLKVGDRYKGFLVTSEGQTKYSLIDPTKNPWPAIESQFRPGTRFTTRVVNYAPDHGAFVLIKNVTDGLDHQINGLLHKEKIPEGVILNRGDEVEVESEGVNPSLRRIWVKFVRKVRGPEEKPPWEPPYAVGDKLEGTVQKLLPQNNLILVQLPKCTGGLHARNMSPSLRTRFEQGDIQVNSVLPVEVVEINLRKEQVYLRNIE